MSRIWPSMMAMLLPMAVLPGYALAQTYPAKPIRIIVSVAVGAVSTPLRASWASN